MTDKRNEEPRLTAANLTAIIAALPDAHRKVFIDAQKADIANEFRGLVPLLAQSAALHGEPGLEEISGAMTTVVAATLIGIIAKTRTLSVDDLAATAMDMMRGLPEDEPSIAEAKRQSIEHLEAHEEQRKHASRALREAYPEAYASVMGTP